MANQFTPKDQTIGHMLKNWDRRGPIPELMNWDLDSDCYEWTRSRDFKGYAHCGMNGKTIRVIRYLLGILEAGPYVHAMHLCDNPPCVNVRHLAVGNNSINIQRSYDVGRASKAGAKNESAKLTEEQVLDILRRLRNGETVKDLSNEYGMGKTAIRSIGDGYSWSSVTGLPNKRKKVKINHLR